MQFLVPSQRSARRNAKFSDYSLLRFFEACRTGDEKYVLDALIANSRLRGVIDNEGNSPLHIAVMAKQTDIVRTLLSAGAKTDAVNSDGDNPFHLLCRYGDFDIINYYARCSIRNGESIFVTDAQGRTPVIAAAAMMNWKLVFKLLELQPDGINDCSGSRFADSGFRLLHYVTFYQGVDKERIIGSLLKMGASKKCITDYGWSYSYLNWVNNKAKDEILEHCVNSVFSWSKEFYDSALMFREKVHLLCRGIKDHVCRNIKDNVVEDGYLPAQQFDFFLAQQLVLMADEFVELAGNAARITKEMCCSGNQGQSFEQLFKESIDAFPAISSELLGSLKSVGFMAEYRILDDLCKYNELFAAWQVDSAVIVRRELSKAQDVLSNDIEQQEIYPYAARLDTSASDFMACGPNLSKSLDSSLLRGDDRHVLPGVAKTERCLSVSALPDSFKSGNDLWRVKYISAGSNVNGLRSGVFMC